MKRRLALACCVFVFSATAFAGIKEGAVTSLMLDDVAPNRIFIKLNGTFLEAEPACASSTAFDFVLDLSTNSGKAWYPMLLAAQASGGTVKLGGTGACLLFGGYEDLRYVQTTS